MSLSGNSVFIPNGPLIASDTLSSKAKVNGMLYPATKLVLPIYANVDDVLEPVAGMLIFNSGTSKLNFYTGSAWEIITSV